MKKKLTLALAVLLAMMTVIIAPFPEKETDAAATAESEPEQTAVPAGEVSADALSLLYEPVYDAENDKAYYCYVYFGKYPQKEVTGADLTEEIINAEYDSNQEAEVSGHKYRRIQRSDTQFKGETINEDDSCYYNWNTGGDVNGYHYFIYEPIRWRVLSIEGTKLFLMADSVLDARIYDSGRCTSWNDSDIRSWLNGYEASRNASATDYSNNNVINKAFTEEQKQALIPCDHASYIEKDSLFLLSDYDTLNEDYGFSSDSGLGCKSRRLSPSNYAFAMGTEIDDDMNHNCTWWLRDQYSGFPFISVIKWDGTVQEASIIDRFHMNTKNTGVCPAMYLDTSLTDTWTLYVPEPEPPVITPTPKPTSEPTATPAPAIVEAGLHAPVYDRTADQFTYSYVYFGEYPQNEVTGEKLTEQIIHAGYDSYGDAIVSGKKYRRIEKSDTQLKGETIEEDSSYYNWNEGGDSEGYHYFLYEPVRWRVISIDGAEMFLMAEQVLDTYVFGPADNWGDSTIRSWLNGYNGFENKAQKDYTSNNFIDWAFTEEQQQVLKPYKNAKNPKDLICLLSADEIQNSALGFDGNFKDSSIVRRSSPTAYAMAMGIKTESIEDKKFCTWWLRSNADTELGGAPYVSAVLSDGSGYGNLVDGKYGIEMSKKDIGVRPVLHLDTSLDSTWYAAEQEEPTATPSPTPVPTPTPAPALLRGDVDGNQIVELLDAQLVLKAVLGIAAIPEEKCSAADCNEDGQITLEDAQTVLKIALGIDEK